MKNLKLILLFSILIKSCLIFGQNKNDTINKQIIGGKQLYDDLHKKEENPLLVIINGVENENNLELMAVINPDDIKEINVLNDEKSIESYSHNAKNGILIVTLKDKKINTLEKLNKVYSFDDGKERNLIISGIIHDSKNISIAGAIVSNLNTKESYYADFEGNYKIKANKNDHLVFSINGFESKTVTIEKETEINIVLNELPTSDKTRIMIKKPVIYLYPTQKTDIAINLDFKGKLLTSFPKYDKNWIVTAYPDGRIFDKKTNRYYTSLFWDGAQNFPKEHYQYQSGFIVSKNDLTNFLIEKLDFMGLNNVETNDFVQYWLPILEKNETNFIHFYVNSDYDVISKNNVTPKPDTSIRIFLEFYGLDKPIAILEQHLPKTIRKGFTLVEWGGSDVGEPIKELKKLKLQMQNFPPNKKIILFDGVCNLCDLAVQFVIFHDKKDVFRFVALQSELGQEILKHIGINPKNIDSIILYEPGIAYYYKSSAALEIAKNLGGLWHFGTVFRIIPTGIRNHLYDYIAKNRFKWYGKKESCMMPTPELKSKFL